MEAPEDGQVKIDPDTAPEWNCHGDAPAKTRPGYNRALHGWRAENIQTLNAQSMAENQDLN